MEYINQKLIYNCGTNRLNCGNFEVMRFILQIHYANDGITTV